MKNKPHLKLPHQTLNFTMRGKTKTPNLVLINLILNLFNVQQMPTTLLGLCLI